MSTGNFYQIDRRNWALICGLGINAACAYLVLACFTAGDNRTTKASVHAIEKYTNISRRRAKEAIQLLISKGFVRQVRNGSKPIYDFVPFENLPYKLVVKNDVDDEEDDEWLWLPKTLVTGAAEETPPVERVRSAQDPKALRLFVDLYHCQNLREDGGISRDYLRREYSREKMQESRSTNVWGFNEGNIWVKWNGPMICHRRDRLTKEEKQKGENPGTDLFRRLDILTALGIIEWVPHLLEGDGMEAEIICPYGLGIINYIRDWEYYPGPDIDVRDFSLEDRLGRVIHQVGAHFLRKKRARIWEEEDGPLLAVVPKLIANVQLIGIARLRYRPHTKLTGAWLLDQKSKLPKWLEFFRRICPDDLGDEIDEIEEALCSQQQKLQR